MPTLLLVLLSGFSTYGQVVSIGDRDHMQYAVGHEAANSAGGNGGKDIIYTLGYEYTSIDPYTLEVIYIKPDSHKSYSSDDIFSGTVVIPNQVKLSYDTYLSNYYCRITSIGDDVFRAKGLTNVIISDLETGISSVIDIKEGAFADNNLTSVTIPNTVISIGQSAFGNNDLTSVTIGNSVETIAYHAFADNDLTSVTIPNSVTSIGESAFANNDLTSVTIGNSVETIADHAFRYNNLTSVTIPNSVTSIGQSAFSSN
ncbi:MAG: leucine-rich repeat domain-containing protein, partial [Algibacter sp.]